VDEKGGAKLTGSSRRPEEKIEKWVQSCCVLCVLSFRAEVTRKLTTSSVSCSNGCAMDVGVKDGKIVAVKGREQDRVNKGRLGPKGCALSLVKTWKNTPDVAGSIECTAGSA
jgi:anaerobic selenocysteine-containing dehydrogenase